MSAYMSLKAVVAHLVGRVLAFAVAERFRNLEYIQQVKCPVFFLHGKMDDLIPCDHSKELYNRCNKGDYWFPNKMTHNSFHIVNDLLIPIDTFLEKYKIKIKMGEEGVRFPTSVYKFPGVVEKAGTQSFMTLFYHKFFNWK